jgi:hypothetical protein
MKQLLIIRNRLVAPKNRKNTFGGYNYRSCEDILEAVKPLLSDHDCNLTLSDEVVVIGTANYIKATATIYNAEGQSVSVQGWAREEFSKKGMDAPQMTGTASSYARKYALNGLFCIDDTKDADTNEYRTENDARAKQTQQQKPQPTAQPQSSKKVLTLEQVKANEEQFIYWLYNAYQVNPNMDVKDKIAEYYDCDYATSCYLSDKFEQYLKNK